MRKRIFTLLLSSLLVFSLVGCGSKETPKPEGEKTPPVTNETPKGDETSKKDEESKDTKKKVKLFFFHMDEMKMVSVDEEIDVKEGALVTALTKAHQENKSDKNLVTLTDKVGVSSAKLDGDVLKVYFNDDFTKYMNLGSASESGLVEGLVNTYGYNYNVKKVAIYCNGELYTGLRGELPEGYYKTSY